MDIQMLFFAALSVAAIVLVVVLAMTLLQLRRSVGHLSRRLDESLRQLEMTAEDLRKTNAVVREILVKAERSAENVAHMTEGVRGFRTSLDAAASVLNHVALPVLGNLAATLAGARAALSHVVNRFGRKEDSHE